MEDLLKRFNEDKHQFDLNDSLMLIKILDDDYNFEDFTLLTILKHELNDIDELALNDEKVEKVEKMEKLFEISDNYDNLLENCCEFGYLTTFTWLIKQHPEDFFIKKYACFANAITNNNGILAKYLYYKTGDNHDFLDSKELLYYSIYSSNTQFVRWIFAIIKDDRIDISRMIACAMQYTSFSNFEFLIDRYQIPYFDVLNYFKISEYNIEVLKGFIQKYSSNISSEEIQKLFSNHLYQGNLEHCKFLHSLGCIGISDDYFEHCFKSNFEFLDWIRQLMLPDFFKSKITKMYERFFSSDEKVYKLIFELKLEIDIEKHLKHACHLKNYNVVEFLADFAVESLVDSEELIKIFRSGDIKIAFSLRKLISNIDQDSLCVLFDYSCKDIVSAQNFLEENKDRNLESHIRNGGGFREAYNNKNLKSMRWLLSFYNESDILTIRKRLLFECAISVKDYNFIRENFEYLFDTINFDIIVPCIKQKFFKCLKLILNSEFEINQEDLRRLFEESFRSSLRICRYMFKISRGVITQKMYEHIYYYRTIDKLRWATTVCNINLDKTKIKINNREIDIVARILECNNAREFVSDIISKTTSVIIFKYVSIKFEISPDDILECYNYNKTNTSKSIIDHEESVKMCEFLIQKYGDIIFSI